VYMTDLKELLQVVDEQDNPIGAETKDIIWREGLWHRVARVLVFNEVGELLMQQRGDKPLFPFRWAESVGGHVGAGDTYEETAMREAEEEIGVSGLSLELLGKYPASAVFEARPPIGTITLNKFETTFQTTLSREALEQFTQTEEVKGIEWWSVSKVVEFTRNNPDKVTDGLESMVEHYLGDR
jgi:isopentenyldiphosphate isomerase